MHLNGCTDSGGRPGFTSGVPAPPPHTSPHILRRPSAGPPELNAKFQTQPYPFLKEATKLQAAREVAAKVEQSVGTDESMRAMEQVEDSQRAVRAEEDEMENWKDHVLGTC